MHEAAGLKRRVRCSTWKRRGSRSDHFFDLEPGALHLADDLHQPVVSAVRRRFALGKNRGGYMPVVIVQPPKRKARGADRTRHVENRGSARLFNTGPVHTGVHVDEYSQAAAL